MAPYADIERQRTFSREWAAARRAEWMAGKVCADCGSDRFLSVHHQSVSMKSIWSRRASYRLPLLAEAVVWCRRCRMRRQAGEEALGWCPAAGVWCDGPERTSRLLRAVERRLAA